MSEWITVKASDGHELQAYVALPAGKARGSVVVVQEIYGVNGHIRSVADSYAEDGYVVIAPALFDRIERGVQLNYSPEESKRAVGELLPKLNADLALLDVATAFKHVESTGKTAVLGFCYGGLMAWLSATRSAKLGIAPACTVGYYAGGVGKYADEKPTCPVMLHFGVADTHIGKDQRKAVRVAHPSGSEPEVQVFEYEGAGHAFNRDVDPNAFHAQAATLARLRTLDYFRTHLG